MRNKTTVQMVVLIVIFISIIFFVAQFLDEYLTQVVTIATALFGVISILYQLQKDHKIKKAEFVYSLMTTFNSNTNIKEIYDKLKLNRDKPYRFNDEEGRQMGDYVMFFDIMDVLVKENLIDIKLVDEIFCSQFFVFMHHPDVHVHQLQYTILQQSIIHLYEVWYNYRVKHKLKVLYPDHSFKDYKDFFFKDDQGLIHFNPARKDLEYQNNRKDT